MSISEIQEVSVDHIYLPYIEKDDDLIAIIRQCFEEKVIKNVVYHFKYENDSDKAPERHFRIIYNPSGKGFQVDNCRFGGVQRLIAYDSTVSEELINRLCTTYNIKLKSNGIKNGQSAFDYFSKVYVLKDS